MTSRGGARRRNNTWFGLQIQRTISDFVCIIKESLYKCNLLSFSFTIYLTDICEHLGNFFGTVCKAANKTINRGSSQRFLKWANEQTNEHGTQVMSKTAKVIRIRGEGREEWRMGWRRNAMEKKVTERNMSVYKVEGHSV